MKYKLVLSLVACAVLVSGRSLGAGAPPFTPPASPRATYNFDPGWKFAFGDETNAIQPDFDDSAWSSVSLPHTWNETDSYRAFISHGGGDQTEKMGIGWYRKHFKLPAGADGQKVFLEFDGMRQAGHFFLNGQPIGKYENGVTAVGLDITKFVKFGGQDNLLAVKVDNSPGYTRRGHRHAVRMEREGFQPEFRRAEPGRPLDRDGEGLPDPAAL